MVATDINLIKSTPGGLGKLVSFEPKLRAISLWALGIFLAAALVLGISYFVVNAQYRQLDAKKAQLTREINASATKEGIMISLKQRIAVAQKALDSARPWGKLFPLLSLIAPVQQFATLSVEENGRVSTIVEVSSVDEAVVVVANTLGLVSEKSLRSPQLMSFSMRANGSVQLGLSFIPIF